MPFKKNLTPLGSKGRIVTNRGKGSSSQRTAPGQQEQVTGGSPIGSMLNRYPSNPQPAPNAAAAPSRPTDLIPQPTAARPPPIGTDPDAA